MPFKSPAQRRYMFANHPEIARRWANKYGGETEGKKHGTAIKRAIKERVRDAKRRKKYG